MLAQESPRNPLEPQEPVDVPVQLLDRRPLHRVLPPLHFENVNLANRQHFSWDFGQDLFGTPRIVKFGASVSF